MPVGIANDQCQGSTKGNPIFYNAVHTTTSYTDDAFINDALNFIFHLYISTDGDENPFIQGRVRDVLSKGLAW